MNKKLFLGMFAAAGMLLATSCSNDELGAAQSGNEAQVTFSLATEDGISTRANTISDGLKTDKLVYAVYKLNANGEPELQKIVNSDENSQFVKTNAFQTNPLKETVTVTLAKAQTYQVAFWAQDNDCTAYDTDDLRNVTVDYTKADGTAAANNDETRDAFFKMVEFYVDGDEVINDIILERPFAQVNVGVYQDDWTAAVASGIEISESKVVIKKAATSIDLLTGEVDGETEVVYDFATIPAQFDPEEELLVDLDGDKNLESYKYLSMSYILANDETTGYAKTSLESLDFEFAPKSGNNIKLEDGLNSVPVRRNWRTNIIGKILTGDVQLNITIDPNFINDYNPMDQLKDILANGGKITLFSDSTLSEPFAIPAGKSVEIDLNGKTLNIAAQGTVEGELTIGNGVINADVDGEGDLIPALVAKKGSTIDFNEANVVVADKQAAVIVEGDDVTVNLNKTTMSGYNGIFAYGSYENLNITLTESTITGTPALYLMYVDATVMLDAKSSAKTFGVYGGGTKVNVVYSGDKPAVEGDGTANTVVYYTTDEWLFKEALANGGTMTLSKDLTLTKAFSLPAGEEVNIDLGSHTLTMAEGVALEGVLNLENGNIVADLRAHQVAFEIQAGSDAQVNMNGVTMTVNGASRHAIVVGQQSDSETKAVINLTNSQIHAGDGYGIHVPFVIKSLEINVTNSSAITGKNGVVISDEADALVNIDDTSKVENIFVEKADVKIIYAGEKPNVTNVNGGAADLAKRTTAATQDEFNTAMAAGDVITLNTDVVYDKTISDDAEINLNGKTFEATNTIKLTNNSNLKMVGGYYAVNSTYGHVDVRPTEGSELVYENVDFSYNKLGPSYGPSTNRLGTVVEVCAEVADAHTVIKFKDCTFDNASVLFEGMSGGKTGTFDAVFEGCTFNALTSSAPIEVQNYVNGTIKLVDCKFNLECTSNTASAVSVSPSSSTSVVVTAENNTINAVAATPYTFDPSKGETEVHTVKVNGTVTKAKFISAYDNTTVNESGTTKTGIAQ